MNINTDIRPENSAMAAQRRSPPSPEHADNAPEKRSPYFGQLDIVEISDEAREASRLHLAAGGNSEDRLSLPYTKEDVASLKDRFSKFHDTERSIHDRLTSLMSKLKLKPGMSNNLKIEIDSNGRAIVGGIDDVKTARALEEAINSDKKLLKDIVAHQKEEERLSLDMREVTGTSLEDYASQIDGLRRAGQDIFLEMNTVDTEFADMLTGHYGESGGVADISGQHNILENAEGTVNKMMSTVTDKITQAFYEMNNGIKANVEDMEDPSQYLDDSLVDLRRLKISVDNSGNVSIEGTASKNNAETDRAAKKIIEQMFQEELQATPSTGEQHDFQTAATYLLNTYDETFGEGNPLGLGEDDRKLEVVYDHGKIESHVSSPKREAELEEEIDRSAKDALKGMGVDATDLVIEMNDEGKLAATNLNPEDPEAKKIQTALDFLNKQLENRSIEDAREEEIALTMDPVKRLKALMTNMDVLRPGGASLLKRAETTEE